jgi:hypothetical protein
VEEQVKAKLVEGLALNMLKICPVTQTGLVDVFEEFKGYWSGDAAKMANMISIADIFSATRRLVESGQVSEFPIRSYGRGHVFLVLPDPGDVPETTGDPRERLRLWRPTSTNQGVQG